MELTNFIIYHNKESHDLFIENNPEFSNEFTHLLQVGNNEKHHGIYAKELPNNIEHIPELLAFTGWYAVAANNLCNTDYIGLFEYDVKFKDVDFKLTKTSILGVKRRPLPDIMYLDSIKKFKNKLTSEELEIAESQPYWNTSTNFIMPVEFFKNFVNWFIEITKDIPINPHIHERAINVFAAINGYRNETIDLIEHLQLNSHKIPL